jgi:pyruvate dehydrogenase E2 component (dihydrolipoamide acetyltransferase)
VAKKIISIPNLGDAAEVEVIEICVKPGDSIGPEDPIVVLESDKAAMELPANTSGTVSSILVNVGDGVSEGVQFVEIETVDEADTAVAPEHIAADIQAPESSLKMSLKPTF